MSFNYGHSLKGYEWLDDEGNAIMYYTFKDLTIHIIQDTTKEELNKFKEWLKEHSCNNTGLNFHYHKVKDYLD